MNIMGVITVTFKEELKKHLKGWTLTPLVQHEEKPLRHSGFVTVLRPLKNESATKFFLRHKVENHTIIKCKCPKNPLRILQLSLSTEPYCRCMITYWRANGWKRSEISNYVVKGKNVYGPGPEYNINMEDMHVSRIRHINRTSKHLTQVFKPCFEISKENGIKNVTPNIAKVLKKSFERGYAMRRKSENHHEELGVVLEGKNFLYDPFKFNYKTIYV